jgi:hypothetical protein
VEEAQELAQADHGMGLIVGKGSTYWQLVCLYSRF